MPSRSGLRRRPATTTRPSWGDDVITTSRRPGLAAAGSTPATPVHAFCVTTPVPFPRSLDPNRVLQGSESSRKIRGDPWAFELSFDWLVNLELLRPCGRKPLPAARSARMHPMNLVEITVGPQPGREGPAERQHVIANALARHDEIDFDRVGARSRCMCPKRWCQGRDRMSVSSSGWSARLYWQWILYNTVAFVVVLTAVAGFRGIGADMLHVSWVDRSRVAALLVATVDALLFGGVLGALQWLVIRQACRFLGKVYRRERRTGAVGLAGGDHPAVTVRRSPAQASAAPTSSPPAKPWPWARYSGSPKPQSCGATPAAGSGESSPTLSLGSSSTPPSTCPVVVDRRPRLHSSRRLYRAGVSDAHRHHAPDRSHVPLGAGAAGGHQ
jgi:hypothetical protein